jgi:hypothetical protein
VSGETLRWRGVLAEDDGDGLTIAELRAFLADAEALAGVLGVDVDQARPLVANTRANGAIRHIWVGVARRRWRHLNVAAGTGR